jgi:spore maturation protein CgeB
MKILYHIPSLDTIYAGRTIYAGYKHAVEDLGHNFYTLTTSDNQEEVFNKIQPDILITSLNAYNLKYLNLDGVERQRKKGMKVFVNTPFWKSPLSQLRINEAQSLSNNKEYINLIRSGKFGDVYYNVCEAGDGRMKGFEETTGYKHHTILLAADRRLHFPEYSEKFKADISYIGTYLPEKRKYIQQQVFPLRSKYDVKLYGQDWTLFDRAKGFSQKVGQYFNIPYLRSLQKPKLELEDERRIYTSSLISINIHEEYQRKFGGDCNERTFKVPACGGFEITDDVACIRKYFKEDEEIIIAKNKDDWFQKIEYYIKNPEKRLTIIEAGRKRVLADHTYHNRVRQIINIFNSLT